MGSARPPLTPGEAISSPVYGSAHKRAREAAADNGPSRTRTWDLAIMSRLL